MTSRVLSAVAILALPGAATPRVALGDPARDQRDFASLRQRARTLVRAQPQAAIAEYTRFLEQHADLDPAIAAATYSALVNLHYSAAKDAPAALAACEKGLDKCGWHPAGILLIAEKARLLTTEKRPGEAEKLIEEQWQRVGTGYAESVNAVLWQYCTALEQQGKKEKLLWALRAGLTQLPQLADATQQSPRAWIHERLVAELLAAGRAREALQWAKLRFVVYPLEKEALLAACRMLARVCAADKALAPVAAGLAAAQRNAGAANPLDGVDLPPVDASGRSAHLARLQNGGQEIHDRVSMYLVAGMPAAALADVRQWAKERADIPVAPEVCRILKATDLNLRRANAFARFASTGEGAKPVLEFLKQWGLASPLDSEISWRSGAVPAAVAEDALAPAFSPEAQAKPPAIVFGPMSAPAVLSQMAAGLLTANEAWDTGMLSLGDLLQALESASRSPDTGYLNDLIGVLAAHAGPGLDAFASLSRGARNRLARYFMDRSDARAEEILKGILAECKTPSPQWVEEALTLPSYYERMGQPAKAVEAYLNAEKYTTHNECLGCAVSLAARACRWAGDKKRAAELYARAPQYNYGWANGHALNDQAGELMREGKHEEARKLPQADDHRADDHRPGLVRAEQREIRQAG